jgi:hypothetical protein
MGKYSVRFGRTTLGVAWTRGAHALVYVARRGEIVASFQCACPAAKPAREIPETYWGNIWWATRDLFHTASR